MLGSSVSLSPFTLLLAAGLVVACVPIPVMEEAPYEQVEKVITIGETTRADLLLDLGVPAIPARSGDLFVYTDFQLQVFALILAAAPSGPAYVGGFGLGKQHLLAVRFDAKGFVESVEAPSGAALTVHGLFPELCLSGGECFVTYERGIVAFAPKNEDAQARRFVARPDKCAVYVYPAAAQYLLTVFLDERYVGFSTQYGYFLWHLDPGKYDLVAQDQWLHGWAKLPITCRASEILYVEYLDDALILTSAVDRHEDIGRGRLILDDL